MGGDPECCTGMWSVNKHWLRNSSALEGWNCKLTAAEDSNSLMFFCWYINRYVGVRATEERGQKRRNNNVKQGERNKQFEEEYGKSNDVYQCVKALSKCE